MISESVEYNENMKEIIEKYNSLKFENKSGTYWNQDEKDNPELYKVKKHIKTHYKRVQKMVCPYCLQKIKIDKNTTWEAEHIIPKDAYPQFLFTPENLCVSCPDCNNEKGNKNVLKTKPKRKDLPKNSDDYLFIHPHFDTYEEHIDVMKDSLMFIPKNDKGRKTIEICGLLRFVYKYNNSLKDSTDKIKKIDVLNNGIHNAKDEYEKRYFILLINKLTDEIIKDF